jgi:NADH-quinone oxidoreductase subunit A
MLLVTNVVNPRRSTRVKQMPYESGMDPIHDTRRRFDVRFSLVAIAFLVFDVELLFLYPWAVTARPAVLAAAEASRAPAAEKPSAGHAAEEALRPTVTALRESAAGRDLVTRNRAVVFPGVMVFIGLLALGFVYDWRKGVFQWR